MTDAAFLAWLVHGGAAAYERMLDEHGGSLALAAHRLAAAKCRAWHRSLPVPTPVDVVVAAREIVDRTGGMRPVPSTTVLVSECVAAGLEVIR